MRNKGARGIELSSSPVDANSMKIFISYRRHDNPIAACMLARVLRDDHGSDAVFLDVDCIPVGVDFQEHIDHRIHDAQVMLVLIGARWDPIRLTVAGDPVMDEILRARGAGLLIIPVVLAPQTDMPTTHELPADLAFLGRHQIERIGGVDPESDMRRLSRALHSQLHRHRAPRFRVSYSPSGSSSPIVHDVLRELRVGRQPQPPGIILTPEDMTVSKNALILDDLDDALRVTNISSHATITVTTQTGTYDLSRGDSKVIAQQGLITIPGELGRHELLVHRIDPNSMPYLHVGEEGTLRWQA